ncbi:hypothetical protein [Actinocrispum wychmicini]|uniref:Uncharacterized protein n=1 Tax=Actinocrispum wychmicini TaxID=1213861 RepID=A0A4R2JF34_9PSEU|nr:hypothetical protein [Actinocrispum wychmicini]TCO57177.1 hypothetical protein EV192_106654 [Actinocrispum wychmicini]
MTQKNTSLGWMLIAWCVALGLIAVGAGMVSSLLMYGDVAAWDHWITVGVIAVLMIAAGLTAGRSLAWLLQLLHGGPRR